MINFIVAITGRISSGKSTFSKQVSEEFGWPIVSFGKYLVDYSVNNGLPINRPALQSLGDGMIRENSQLFLQSVLDFFNVRSGQVIIEGVRHNVIWKELKNRSRSYELIYIDAPQLVRYERFCKRLKPGDDSVSFAGFQSIDNHAVEAEIDELKLSANYIVTSGSPEEQTLIKALGKYV